MARHILKTLWNRRRQNALLVLEITVSFLTVFAVMAMSFSTFKKYASPLGFSYANVWGISIHPTQGHTESSGGAWDRNDAAELGRLVAGIQEFPEVESADVITMPLFSIGEMTTRTEHRGKSIVFRLNYVSDSVQDTLELKLIEGRCFGPQDDGLAQTPVLINRQLREELLEGEEVVGSVLHASGGMPLRVVGVIEDFRQGGEFSSLRPTMLARYPLGASNTQKANHIVLRLREGTTAVFEEQLIRRMLDLSTNWHFTIKPLSESRHDINRILFLPILTLATLGSFMMLMVVLGLLGVLWKNVIQRRAEFGLRRAVGATGRAIGLQIIAEMLMIATFSIALGAVVILQIPLLGVFAFMDWEVAFTVLGGSSLVIYGLTIICTLFPGLMSSRIQPADALRYE